MWITRRSRSSRRARRHTLEVHGLLAPSIFEPFASVTIMGANLDDSIMYKYFAKEGCTFSDHTAINNGLQYRSHDNGSRLLIKYLTERKVVEDPPQSEIRNDGDQDVAEDICDVYMDLCQQEAAKHSKLPPLWIGNNDIRSDEFDGRAAEECPTRHEQLHDARGLLHLLGAEPAASPSQVPARPVRDD